MLFAIGAPGVSAAVKETVLHSFNSTSGTDGYLPFAGLIIDHAGNLNGTTELVSTNPHHPISGMVFRISPDGTETVLHFFDALVNGSDGGWVLAPLVADGAGNMYGTTLQDGAYGQGTVFRVSPDGSETVLYSFKNGSDGASPQAGLIFDKAGNLYGTTNRGGNNDMGTVFKLTPNGAETVLHSFTGGSDGSYPQASLVADKAGNLYGTTRWGGMYNLGTVFRVSKDGTETVVHSFGTGKDGAHPDAGLIADLAGNLYGTTVNGGSNGYGTVFRIAANGTETVLHSFGGTDGAGPEASLIVDAAGSFYGTTAGGGLHGYGTVFKLTRDGTETVLYSFDNADGANPYAPVVNDSAGNLFGTTLLGGAFASGFDTGGGTVFKLSGTGFVTAVPFCDFDADLAIRFGGHPGTDSFALVSRFTLGRGSNGIHPLTEPMTIQAGTYTTTIPAGSFKTGPFGTFHFEGMLNGVELQVFLTGSRDGQYGLVARGEKANLGGTMNPVSVTITIGDDIGTTSVKASLSHAR